MSDFVLAFITVNSPGDNSCLAHVICLLILAKINQIYKSKDLKSFPWAKKSLQILNQFVQGNYLEPYRLRDYIPEYVRQTSDHVFDDVLMLSSDKNGTVATTKEMKARIMEHESLIKGINDETIKFSHKRDFLECSHYFIVACACLFDCTIEINSATDRIMNTYIPADPYGIKIIVIQTPEHYMASVHADMERLWYPDHSDFYDFGETFESVVEFNVEKWHRYMGRLYQLVADEISLEENQLVQKLLEEARKKKVEEENERLLQKFLEEEHRRELEEEENKNERLLQEFLKEEQRKEFLNEEVNERHEVNYSYQIYEYY